MPKEWYLFPGGAKQGVQTQGTHQPLGAGTQRAQKHTSHLTAGMRVYACRCVSLEVAKCSPPRTAFAVFGGIHCSTLDLVRLHI